MKLFLSNRLEVLADSLRDSLFSKKNPFDIPYVIVPCHQIKNFLVYRWAKDEKVQIVAGIKILTIAEALYLFFPHVPTPIQLSFQIEELLENPPHTSSLSSYLTQGGPSRLGAFSDQVSSFFLDYGICEKETLEAWIEKEGWQQDLWKRLWPQQTPWQRGEKVNFSLYLFHLSFLPSFYFKFFQTMEISVYHLSPSSMFWGDFYIKIVTEQKQSFTTHMTRL